MSADIYLKAAAGTNLVNGHNTIVLLRQKYHQEMKYRGSKLNLFEENIYINTIVLLNPFHAETLFVHERKMQKSFENHLTMSCWYSLDSYH